MRLFIVCSLSFFLFAAVFRSVAVAAPQNLALPQNHRYFSVWAVNDGEKVDQHDLNHHSKRRNSVWNGKRLRIFAAKNEVVAFQVMVQSGNRPIRRLRASLPHLTRRMTGEQIRYRRPTKDPSFTRRRPIQIFSANYMNVTEPTSARWIYDSEAPSAPADPTGFKPVQLIPQNAKRGQGGLPMRVARNSNQSLWFEIYTGQNRRPGRYDGTIRVEGSGRVTEIPITLTIFDFQLSNENSMNMIAYYESHQLDLYHGADREAEYHRFAHRHRIELTKAYDKESLLEASGRFDGSDFSGRAGYHGPGQNKGNRIAPATFYGAGSHFKDKAATWSYSDHWMSFLSEQFPALTTFLYAMDEPGPSQYPMIREISESVKSNPGIGSMLPVLITRAFTAALSDNIDIWVSTPGAYDAEQAALERSRGNKYWMYNGGRPHTGAVVIEAPATDPRAIIWSCFRYSIDTYFYWHAVHWLHNHQKPGNKIQNIWRDPITFDNREQPGKHPYSLGAANGDGVLLYPGEDYLHPEEDRGIAGPVSTIQLANFRRGLQDHQYLTIARELGLEHEVEEALNKVVPHTLSDTNGQQIGFAEDGNTYEEARIKLGRAIQRAMRHQRNHKN